MANKRRPVVSLSRRARVDQGIRRKYFDFDGLRLSYLEAGPSRSVSRQGTILIVHANGFSAGCYSYYIRRLKDRYHVLAIDLAGHGASQASLEYADWNFFRDQVLALCEHADVVNAIGIGHSLGGACLMRAAAVTPAPLSKIIALDPVVLNIPMVAYMKVFGNPMQKQALARRNEFRSSELVERAFRRFGFEAEVFGDFTAACFREDGDRVVLACPPAVEARTFGQADFASLAAYGRLQTEVHFLLPEQYQVCSPRGAGRVTRNNPASSVTLIPNAGHLFPFEEPALTMAEILQRL